MRFGIIQRYVMGEVLRSFILALVTMSTIFVLFMVMAEALRIGLTPSEIARLVPFVVPSTLPYSVPVSLLFAVTVVYGRLASDNEIIAIKAAGQSALTVLWPALALGTILSASLLYSSNGLIPLSTVQARLTIFKNTEEMFYKFLKKDRELNNPKWPFLIFVRDVDGRVLLDPIFKHRAGGTEKDSFDATITAKTAIVKFDAEHDLARVYLDGAEILQKGKQAGIFLINDNILEIHFPSKSTGTGNDRRPLQELTTREMIAEQALLRKKLANEQKRKVLAVAFAIGSGRTNQAHWGEVQSTFVDYHFWERRLCEYETEKQQRVALGCGSFFFVVLGAPVGIRFAKRDFLSAFITCFLPIILLYYPLTLLGINLGKDGLVRPDVALWTGNLILGVLAGFAMPPIIRH